VRSKSEPAPGVYHDPDVIISLLNDKPDSPLVVEILLPIMGTLQVSRMFREAIKRAPADRVEEWKSDLERASLLVKCLRQRNHTMVRMMQHLAAHQREFILEGDAQLKPMTRAKMAKELEVHESTISRAVSDKTVQLTNGRIIPLATFFDRSLHIRAVLKEIIAQETKPLSDSQVKKILAEKGHKVARRTVAKYRAMEGILPAHLRHAAPSPSPA
jgi:RNA polymerase sigma-54 factor